MSRNFDILKINRMASLRRQWTNRLMLALLFVAVVIAVLPLLMVFKHILVMGLPSLNWDFVTALPGPTGQIGGGMANAILGSFVMILIAAVISVPFGMAAGVFLSEYGDGKFGQFVDVVVDLVASLPSILIGLFVYSILVLPYKTFSALAGAVSLSLIMLPVVIKSTKEVMQLIPNQVREAGLALGLSRWRVIVSILVKGQIASILTGVMLAIARAAGETAPLLLTAFGNRNWLHSLTEPTASLPVQIYNYAISPYEDWHRQAWAGAFVLVALVFSLNIFSRLVVRMQRGIR